MTRTWSDTTTLAVEAFTAETNIKGRVMYGYNWQLRRCAFPDKAGWWRLTFSTSDGSVLFTEQTIPTPPPDEIGDETGEPVFVPVIESDKTYIDIYISASRGGGGRK